MKYLPIFACLLLFSGICSCGKSYFYNKTINIKESGWLYDDPVVFDVDILDTLRIYNLHLDIQHDKDYSKQNLYVKIHTGFPGGETVQQVLSFDLMDKKGLWYGDCSGNSCTLRVNMQNGAFFSAPGKHQFKIEQFMRFEPVKSIQSISLYIEETQQSR